MQKRLIFYRSFTVFMCNLIFENVSYFTEDFFFVFRLFKTEFIDLNRERNRHSCIKTVQTE